MTRFRTILITVAAATLLSTAAAAPAWAAPKGQASGCLSDQEIQGAIASGQIKSWPKIKKMAQIPSNYQEVSDVQVCMVGGVPFYRVNLVSSSGEAKKIQLNAVTGGG
ncbi:MAG: hypothetical protein ACTHNL_00715 [Devosia sp.]|jgi:uncharacterized membrane protein YkoI